MTIRATVRLVPFSRAWLPAIQPWFAHPEVQRWLGGPGWPGLMLDLIERFEPGQAFRGAVVLARFGLVGVDAAGAAVSLVDVEVYDRATRYDGQDVNGPTFEDAEPEHRPVAGLSIVIDPARWRQGFGLATLRALLAHPALAPVPIVEAGVEPGNTASQRLFEGAGFRLEDDTPDWEGMLTYRYERGP